MSMVPKFTYLLSVIPIKTPMMLLSEIEKSILKFKWNFKREFGESPRSQSNLKKEE